MISEIDTTESPWVTLNHQGSRLLAAPLPQGLRPLQMKALAPSGEKLLWFFRGEIKYLPLKGWRQIDDTTWLILPLFEGRSAGALSPFPGRQECAALMGALAALEEYADHSAPGAEDPFLKELLGSPLQPGGILFPEPGGVAFLRPRFAAAFLGLTGRQGESWDLSSPRLSPPKQTAFSAALMIYRGLTGRDPFTGSEEERRERITRNIYLPLEAFFPELPENFSQWLTDALEGGSTKASSLKEGFSLLSKTLPDLPPAAGTPDPVNPAYQVRQRNALKRYEKKERALKARRFFRRRGALVLLVLILTGAAAALVSPVITRALAPPLTRGWEPEEVVRGFYEGINNLDPELLDGVTHGKAGKQRRNQVTSLFAISRIRLGYEGVSPQINAREWVEGGQRPLEEGELLYGISDLRIRRMEDNRYLAVYREWTSEAEGESSGQPLSEREDAAGPLVVSGWEISEELTLEQIRDAWMITDIRPVSREKIAPE